jgi:F420-0:gamma-glutamyl ligase
MMNIAVDDKVAAAARWLSEQSEMPVHVVRTTKEKFQLSALQTCQALKMASECRMSGSVAK